MEDNTKAHWDSAKVNHYGGETTVLNGKNNLDLWHPTTLYKMTAQYGAPWYRFNYRWFSFIIISCDLVWVSNG